MKYTYCTLFDYSYYQKGVVTIESLINVAKEYRLYVLAMDDNCFQQLKKRKYQNVYIIKYNDFYRAKLFEISEERDQTELCWTCSANLIEYIFETYGEEYCTYIDADMFFYSDPSVLIDEMIQAGKTVQIMEHRIKAGFYGRKLEKMAGRFCVEFNTFQNEENARKLLSEWKSQINNHCSKSTDGKTFGDQMYLNDWPLKYSFVHINQNIGAGIAPWNINRYSRDRLNGKVLYDNKNGVEEIVFYHFHSVKRINENEFDIGVFSRFWKIDQRLVSWFYNDYLCKLIEIEEKSHKLVKFEEKRAPREWKKEILRRLSLRNLVQIRWSIDLFLKNRLNHKKDIIKISEWVYRGDM